MDSADTVKAVGQVVEIVRKVWRVSLALTAAGALFLFLPGSVLPFLPDARATYGKWVVGVFLFSGIFFVTHVVVEGVVWLHAFVQETRERRQILSSLLRLSDQEKEDLAPILTGVTNVQIHALPQYATRLELMGLVERWTHKYSHMDQKTLTFGVHPAVLKILRENPRLLYPSERPEGG